VLIPLFVIMLITGYRNLNFFTFLGRGEANLLHYKAINIPFIVLFAAHALLSIRIALQRNKVRGYFTDVVLLLIGILFTAVFIYFSLSSGF
jgi:hypothetical protein